jgi:arsenical pump membrane protein
VVFRRDLPAQIGAVAAPSPEPEPPLPPHLRPHPHALRRQPLPHPIPLPPHRLPPPPPHGHRPPEPPPRQTPAPGNPGFMWFAVGVVVVVRIGYFAASLYHIPTYVVAVAGAAFLLLANMRHRVVDPRESLRKAPWAILGFALGMDLIVFGLRNAGITGFVAQIFGPAIATRPEGAAFLPGLLAAGVSALLNNHPGLIIGSLTLLQIVGLQKHGLHTAYSGVVIGSDLGALITPAGTLASLIWLHMLRQEGHRYTWWDYVRVTAMVIPLSFFLALCGLYGVARWTGL